LARRYPSLANSLRILWCLHVFVTFLGNLMMLQVDCRHFPGSRPCRFNKESGQTCPDCPHYQRKGKRILITKLDALGDVLRTTALLPGLKAKYPDSYIVWITKSSAAALFINNPFVDELWLIETEAVPRLLTEEFDLVINTDTDKWTTALASMAKTLSRFGMVINKEGHVIPVNTEAIDWLEMGAFDRLKKANQKTYQQIVYEMCRLEYRHQRPILNLTASEQTWGTDFLAGKGRDPRRKLIGLNLGGGGRWKNKRWTEHHIVTFSRQVVARADLQLLLIGGPWERELMDRLQATLASGVLFSDTDRTLRELASLVAACDTLVTGDSLALHIATALGTRVIALFGPTSAAEIELYDHGTSIVPSLPCCCCYLPTCAKKPDCMTSITPEEVLKHLST
jgi:ADP-heptose:LPS heptosyltransferase